MKTKCVSVRLESLRKISEKAYKATDFNGNEDVLPASCIFGEDYDVQKSDAYWIAEWILQKKSITYSGKKVAWFSEDGRMLPTYHVSHHTPDSVKPVEDNTIEELDK